MCLCSWSTLNYSIGDILTRMKNVYSYSTGMTVIFYPFYSAADLGITSDYSLSKYCPLWWKKMVQLYSASLGGLRTILIGSINPNSWGCCIGFTYGFTDNVNGIPRYCAAAYLSLDSKIYTFGQADGTWFLKGFSGS